MNISVSLNTKYSTQTQTKQQNTRGLAWKDFPFLSPPGLGACSIILPRALVL